MIYLRYPISTFTNYVFLVSSASLQHRIAIITCKLLFLCQKYENVKMSYNSHEVVPSFRGPAKRKEAKQISKKEFKKKSTECVTMRRHSLSFSVSSTKDRIRWTNATRKNCVSCVGVTAKGNENHDNEIELSRSMRDKRGYQMARVPSRALSLQLSRGRTGKALRSKPKNDSSRLHSNLYHSVVFSGQVSL